MQGSRRLYPPRLRSAGIVASLLTVTLLLTVRPVVLAQIVARPPVAGAPPPAWPGYAGNGQHTAPAPVAAQALEAIHWQFPVDLLLQHYAGELFIHYGSPLITHKNTVVLTTRTTAQNNFQLQGICGYVGQVMWTQTTDYTTPPAGWIPSCGSTLTPNNTLVIPGAGGTVWRVSNIDTPNITSTRLAFYGLNAYNADQTGLNANVYVDTPITSDRQGNIYFGFEVLGANSANLQGGLARIAADGTGTWVAAATAANDTNMLKVAQNCAPAISNDGSLVYVAVNGYGDNNGAEPGYLLALNSKTLATVGIVRLKDVKSGLDANVIDDGTATPMVGPDDDVYYGVLEIPWISNNDRGWMLHFDKLLTTTKTPGLFGWDDTASVVPASAVPSYKGSSSYLILTKYNRYADFGLMDGLNEVGILDPNATMTDNYTGATVMDEVITVRGVTPNSGLPGVREWCINSAAVDPLTKSALINSEDGTLYRWDFTTNSLTQKVVLTPGVGEAYTPTAVGPDGTTYAINDAVLFAVGLTTPDISGAVTVTRGCMIGGMGQGLMMQPVRVTNTLPYTLNGPILLALDNLSANATLLNTAGMVAGPTSGSSPYATVNTRPLAPGASYTVLLMFQNTPFYKPISYTTRVLGGIP